LALELAGEGPDEVLAQEARWAITVRLVNGKHSFGPEPRRPDRGGDLLGIVGEVVDHLDGARLADGLEPASDPFEGGERLDHVGKLDAEHPRRGDGGESVGDVMRSGNREHEGYVLHPEMTRKGVELDVLAANVSPVGQAESER